MVFLSSPGLKKPGNIRGYRGAIRSYKGLYGGVFEGLWRSFERLLKCPEVLVMSARDFASLVKFPYRALISNSAAGWGQGSLVSKKGTIGIPGPGSPKRNPWALAELEMSWIRNECSVYKCLKQNMFAAFFLCKKGKKTNLGKTYTSEIIQSRVIVRMFWLIFRGFP